MEKNIGGAWIPPQIYHNSDLKPSEKLLAGRIHSLSSKTGWCWASNSYFAEEFNASSRTIKRKLQSLEEIGILIREQDDEGHRIMKIRWAEDNDVTGGGQKCPAHLSEEYSKEQEPKGSLSKKDKMGEIVEYLDNSNLNRKTKWAIAGKWINNYKFRKIMNALKEIDSKNKWDMLNERDKGGIIGYIVEVIKNSGDGDQEDLSNQSKREAMGR